MCQCEQNQISIKRRKKHVAIRVPPYTCISCILAFAAHLNIYSDVTATFRFLLNVIWVHCSKRSLFKNKLIITNCYHVFTMANPSLSSYTTVRVCWDKHDMNVKCSFRSTFSQMEESVHRSMISSIHQWRHPVCGLFQETHDNVHYLQHSLFPLQKQRIWNYFSTVSCNLSRNFVTPLGDKLHVT